MARHPLKNLPLPVGPWWGRVLAPVLGVVLLGPWGLLAGLVAGYLLDRCLRLLPFMDRRWPGAGTSKPQRRIYISTFAVMGHIAKADGRVSEDEVGMAQLIMDELGLRGQARSVAIDMFRRGKARNFPLHTILRRLRRVCRQHERRERFLSYQLRVATADGLPSPEQREILHALCRTLLISRLRMEQLLQRRAEAQRQGGDRRSLKPTLRNAYALLGVEETASEDEIRLAYRRCISRNHPDRSVASGMPEGEVRAAARRTHEIRLAFDEIRRVRNF